VNNKNKELRLDMKAALTTPFLGHLPLHPGSYIGYATALLNQKFNLDVLDFNADIYFKNRQGLKKVLSDIDQKPVVIDNLDLAPFYYELLKRVEKEYKKIPWKRYQQIFITTPTWFTNVYTKNIVQLAGLIKRESPKTSLFFFGNSLGTWTDENVLKENDIRIVHLNDLFKLNPESKPVDYDSLPTPVYKNRYKYIFNILPFRLKHGCIWGKCKFCSLAKGWNSGYRERSAKTAVKEIEELDRLYNPTMLVCRDNSINGHHLHEFCTRLENFQKPWAAMARADLEKKDLQSMHKAGCRLIYFGMESGSDHVLNKINKGIHSKQISTFIRNLYETNITPAPSLFVGAPGETEEDFKKTIHFITHHKPYLRAVNVYPLSMTPASNFAVEGAKPSNKVLLRLFELIRLCKEMDLKICVGEQSAEYIFGKKIYPESLTY